MNKVLVLEPYSENETLSSLLCNSGYETESLSESCQGLERAFSGQFALALVDTTLLTSEGVNSVEFLHRLRAQTLLPVLLIAATNSDTERVLALEFGADDYLQKPFLPQELIARTRAILRRAGTGISYFQHLIKVSTIELDKVQRIARQNGRNIELTSAEFDLLELLLKKTGQTVTRDEIAQMLLGRTLEHNERSVDMHISNLRRKLRASAQGENPNCYIKSIRGVGYLFIAPQQL